MNDLLDLDAKLSSEDEQLRDEARAFVDEAVRPIIGDHYREGTFPTHLVPELAERGYIGATFEEYGGAGLTERQWGVLQRELAAGDSSIRSFVNAQSMLVMRLLDRFGSDAQQRRWLPKIGAGDAIGAFGMTEPEHGSDAGNMETYAERDGNGFVLSGQKKWISFASMADFVIVWAHDCSLDGAPIRAFLVETDRDGIDVRTIDDRISFQCGPVSWVDLDSVRVPADARLPGGEGLKGPLSCTTDARYGISWSTVGVARDCYESALDYATDREQFGTPIAGFQLQQGKLADMATQVATGQLLAFRLTELRETGELRPVQASMGKRHNTAMARDVARTAREMLGGEGTRTVHSPMRHLANIESVYTYEGTYDIQTLILGQELTDISAFQ